jgi:hypothetical protein
MEDRRLVLPLPCALRCESSIDVLHVAMEYRESSIIGRMISRASNGICHVDAPVVVGPIQLWFGLFRVEAVHDKVDVRQMEEAILRKPRSNAPCWRCPTA